MSVPPKAPEPTGYELTIMALALNKHFSKTMPGATAYARKRGVRVLYDAHSAANLNRQRAAAYLAWLDAGNTGTHWTAEGCKDGHV